MPFLGSQGAAPTPSPMTRKSSRGLSCGPREGRPSRREESHRDDFLGAHWASSKVSPITRARHILQNMQGLLLLNS
jgi:hypothetical protein